MTDPARIARRELTRRWLDTAVRPDISPLPVESTSAGGPERPVQMRGGADQIAAPASDVHQLASAGTSGASTLLPHFDRIQQSFGRHDVSGVRAHVGGPAAEASQAMGAEAYATGDHVAFRRTPDLHTAAHEAAHVVQQRGGVQLAGGVGKSGDACEQHADRVADMVVRGESAEAELSRMASEPSCSGARGSTVQHKLKLTGKQADYQRALNIMNRGMFGHTASVDAKGYVVLTEKKVKGKPNAQQKAMYDYLNEIISDAKDVTIAVGSKTEPLVGSYANESIDMSDIEAMAGGGGSSPQGALIHELVEQYHKQIMEAAYGGHGSGAHGEGIAAENAVNGTVRGAQKVVSVSRNPDGTIDAVVEIPFTHPDGKVVTTTLTIESNDIDKAEDKVTKKGGGK